MMSIRVTWWIGVKNKIRKAHFARQQNNVLQIFDVKEHCALVVLKTFKVCLLVFLDEIWGSSIATSHL